LGGPGGLGFNSPDDSGQQVRREELGETEVSETQAGRAVWDAAAFGVQCKMMLQAQLVPVGTGKH
jgi:hypothetical protein